MNKPKEFFYTEKINHHKPAEKMDWEPGLTGDGYNPGNTWFCFSPFGHIWEKRGFLKKCVFCGLHSSA